MTYHAQIENLGSDGSKNQQREHKKWRTCKASLGEEESKLSDLRSVTNQNQAKNVSSPLMPPIG